MPYWAELWPSGVFLAAAVGERDLRGTRVLELGCGLGVERRRRARRRRRAGNGLGARGARGHAPERRPERRRRFDAAGRLVAARTVLAHAPGPTWCFAQTSSTSRGTSTRCSTCRG